MQKQLRSERDREYRIIENAKNIITDAIGVEVDSTQHILIQLEEAVQKFNEDCSGQEKLIEKDEKKFDNKVLEHIAQKIAINQVELSTFLGSFENSFNNVTSLFAKLCDVSGFTKEIKDKLNKIDIDMQLSASKLKVDSSSSTSHHTKIIYLAEVQAELLREEARIRTTLIDIQHMILPIMDTMQNHIAHCKTLIQEQNFSVADHLIQLSAKVQISLSTYQVLQQSWDSTLATILKVHQDFLSHFGVAI